VIVDTLQEQHFRVRQRNISATLQAWAMQPRGVNGGSASKTSLIEPMPTSARCGSNENGGGKVCHGSGGIVPLLAE
jgi:hypothetical protein